MLAFLQQLRVRRWIYSITTSALLVLAAYGLLDGQQLAVWTGLAASVTGLAWANTSSPDEA